MLLLEVFGYFLGFEENQLSVFGFFVILLRFWINNDDDPPPPQMK